MFLGFSLSTALSGVFGKTLASSEGSTEASSSRDVGTSIEQWILNGKLKFHHVHGREIQLLENNTLAQRTENYFEHSVVFSDRPVSVNEVVAVEITKVTSEFCGPLRIGFTSIDPMTFQNELTVPLGRHFQDTPGVWFKGLLLHQLDVGSVVHYVVNNDGIILHAIDGEEAGVIATGVDTTIPLWTVLEAYGSVQGFKFVDKPMVFTFNRQPASMPHHDENANNTLNRRGRTVRTPNQDCCSNIFSLFARRNSPVSPLQNMNSVDTFSGALISPMTPGYLSPMSPGSSNFIEQEMCIICLEREKNTAFTKCGHLCMCYQCAEEFMKRRAPSTSYETPRGRNSQRPLCPICRGPISSLFRIYS